VTKKGSGAHGADFQVGESFEVWGRAKKARSVGGKGGNCPEEETCAAEGEKKKNQQQRRKREGVGGVTSAPGRGKSKKEN